MKPEGGHQADDGSFIYGFVCFVEWFGKGYNPHGRLLDE